jgi:glutamyl/glutaminyl-tRNA synthetase
MVRTRMAPTPSGFLHIGNAANLLITSWLAQGGVLALRIDDMDTARTRPEYVQDIFDVTHWLGIDWAIGPRDAPDHASTFALALHTERYRAGLQQLVDSGLQVFACTCSRTDLAGSRSCVADCRSAARPVVPGESALRAVLPDVEVEVDGARINLRDAHGDVVLWRRDDLPAYHLVTVLEDRDLGTTDVVRGMDLLDSSALHVWLAARLHAAPIRYRHHGLVPGPMGMKLSKSQGTISPLPRTHDNLGLVAELARDLAGPLGIRPPGRNA